MKASTSSLHARLYRFTYTSDLPANLCPYFWKLVLAVLLFIPNFILQLPGLIIDLFIKPDKGAIMLNASDNRIGGVVFYLSISFLWLYFYLTIHLIKQIFNCYSYSQDASIGGAMINIFIIILVLRRLAKNIVWKFKNSKPDRPKEPSIVVEFVKAKYNKYCPKIEWHEKSES